MNVPHALSGLNNLASQIRSGHASAIQAAAGKAVATVQALRPPPRRP